MPPAAISCAEQWTYRKTRRGEQRASRWIRAVAAEKYGSVWVDFEVWQPQRAPFCGGTSGCRSRCGTVRTGTRVSLWFPPDRHIVGKCDAVNRDKGLHSVFRTPLNRLGRQMKGYTKSLAMLAYSLALVCRYRERKSNTRLF